MATPFSKDIFIVYLLYGADDWHFHTKIHTHNKSRSRPETCSSSSWLLLLLLFLSTHIVTKLYYEPDHDKHNNNDQPGDDDNGKHR